MSTPRDRSPIRRRIPGRVTFAILGGAALVAQLAVVPAVSAEAAVAASAPSSLTVTWLNDDSSAAGDQPPRDSNSPHYNEMRNISVTVSQTEDIIDQAIRVEISGFAGTRAGGFEVVNGQNFVQAMQCWGEDPNADDFVETCQWGGRIPVVLGNSVYFDNNNRVSGLDYDPFRPTAFDNPFYTVSGTRVTGKGEIRDGKSFSPLLSYFGPSTTNEVPVARIGSDGTGYFDFETQSSSQAPHMGCGTEGHLRCWLVIVPRGTKFGGDGRACSDLVDRNGENYSYGQTTPIQGGSPVNPKCDYFENRIVVPLDFTPTGVTCPAGSPEFRVSGSQFLISAMSSWQPSLCQTVRSTFSFATNPDSVARAQLLDTRTGSPELIYSGYPVSSGELQTPDERTLLSQTTLQYAPVAISSVVVAYNAEFANGRPGTLNLTPRLMAKLLTQSYTFTVPSSTADPDRSVAHLSAQAQTYRYWNQDPDFRAANPTNWQSYDQQNPSLVLPGPAAADGIKQVWRWILADADAVAFLNGAADPDGMTINPYYLPKTATNTIPWFYDDLMNFIPAGTPRIVGEVGLDGGPYSLSSAPLDVFLKDDGSLLPYVTSQTSGTTRFDSIQFAPYAQDYLSAARQAFRGDPNSKTFWDATKLQDDGSMGAWVSAGVQDAGARFMIAVTDSANAARYGLTTAAIAPANASVPVASTPTTMNAALAALTATTLDTVLQVNPANVGAGAYPLTMVTYAGVNLTKSTSSSRQTIANMLQQVATTGQVSGTAIGELPVGYLPLTSTLQDQAKAAASTILTWSPPSPTPTPTPNAGSQIPTYSEEDSLVDPTAEGGTDPSVTTGVDELTGERTLASNASPLERSGLAIALVLGLIGFIGAPLLLRRRGYL
ncbi:hypothetical protein [Pseudolysinimonas sp.]|uniref:hypothetical protein n=1 Tax=Pseudolysinimonas sp. TaxID=2680009 RepID=UPI00286B8E3B|nr:hypothetical protein [Pseudolysinimonas sp.]